MVISGYSSMAKCPVVPIWTPTVLPKRDSTLVRSLFSFFVRIDCVTWYIVVEKSMVSLRSSVTGEDGVP